MDGTCSQKAISDSPNTRKRKRDQKDADPLDVKRQSFVNNNNNSIDKLPDDLLIAILSCMSFKDSVRTSVLSCRWKYLWAYASGNLEFDDSNNSTGVKIKRKNFKAWVNRILSLHRGPRVDSLLIRFTNLRSRAQSRDIDSWIYFAMRKEVKKFELNLSVENGFHCSYKFPNIHKLLSLKSSVLGSLRSLRLVDVDIEDDVVHYLLASCPFIEYLCIRASHATKILEVVDPLPNLKELEISDCCNLQSMEISAPNLVSCTYQGGKISPPFKKTPNLTELTLGKRYCESFIREPNKHSSYSVQLVKLVLNLQGVGRERTKVPRDLHQLYALKRLELNIMTDVGRSLLFFNSLIKASPNLEEFKIKIEYIYRELTPRSILRGAFPDVRSSVGFHHENLKVVEMAGFVGFPNADKFLVQLLKVAPSIEMVSIDTQSDFYLYRPLAQLYMRDGRKRQWIERKLRARAKSSAKTVKRNSPPGIKFVIV